MSSHGKNIGGAKPDIDDANYQVGIYIHANHTAIQFFVKNDMIYDVGNCEWKFLPWRESVVYKFVFPKPRV